MWGYFLLCLLMALPVLGRVARLCSNSMHSLKHLIGPKCTSQNKRASVLYQEPYPECSSHMCVTVSYFPMSRSVSTWDRSPWPKNWRGKLSDCWKRISLGPGLESFSKRSWKNIGIPVPWASLQTILVRSEKLAMLCWSPLGPQRN